MPNYLTHRLLVVVVGLQGYLVLQTTYPPVAALLAGPAAIVAMLCVLGALLVAVVELVEKFELVG